MISFPIAQNVSKTVVSDPLADLVALAAAAVQVTANQRVVFGIPQGVLGQAIVVAVGANLTMAFGIK